MQVHRFNTKYIHVEKVLIVLMIDAVRQCGQWNVTLYIRMGRFLFHFKFKIFSSTQMKKKKMVFLDKKKKNVISLMQDHPICEIFITYLF